MAEMALQRTCSSERLTYLVHSAGGELNVRAEPVARRGSIEVQKTASYRVTSSLKVNKPDGRRNVAQPWR